jgi:hypothetical protein
MEIIRGVGKHPNIGFASIKAVKLSLTTYGIRICHDENIVEVFFAYAGNAEDAGA